MKFIFKNISRSPSSRSTPTRSLASGPAFASSTLKARPGRSFDAHPSSSVIGARRAQPMTSSKITSNLNTKLYDVIRISSFINQTSYEIKTSETISPPNFELGAEGRVPVALEVVNRQEN